MIFMEKTTNEFIRIFSEKISCIRTVNQKVSVLADMEEYFRERVRNNPKCRNELSAAYQYLKIECEGAVM